MHTFRSRDTYEALQKETREEDEETFLYYKQQFCYFYQRMQINKNRRPTAFVNEVPRSIKIINLICNKPFAFVGVFKEF